MPKIQDKKLQRGAIGLFGVLVLLLAILFTTLAVDSARLWMVKRQLQRIADMAAIEAASGLACNPDANNVMALAQQAAARNGFSGSLATAPNAVEVGSVSTIGGRRVFDANGSAGGVRVVVSNTVPSSLIAGGLFGENVLISAEAVSLPNVPVVSFGVGGTAVSLNTEQSVLLNRLLGQMLGTPINLGLASYLGLADTGLTLANLISAQGQVLSAEELLSLPMSSRDALRLIADAVGLDSDIPTTVLNDTISLANAVVSNTTLTLGQVLQINPALHRSALDTSVNLLSLVTSMLMVANGQNAIDFPLGVNVPGLASVNTRVRVIEWPKIVVGPAADAAGNVCTSASSAQVVAEVTAQIAGTLDLKLSMEVARSDADLMTVASAGTSTDVRFDVRRGLVDLRLGNAAGTRPATISLLGLTLAEVGLNFMPNPANSSSTEIEVPRPVDDHLPMIVSTGNPNGPGFESLLSQPARLDVRVLGINLPIIGQVVSTVIQPLLVQIGRNLLDPLAGLLGIQTNNVDILLQDVTLMNPNPLVI